jgi:oxygen-dependent protoporphyrinogen oxidase
MTSAAAATAAWLVDGLGDGASLVVLEAADRAGGKVFTQTVAGLPVDTGPDAFLSRAPELKALIAHLGLTEAVQGPAASGAFVWSRGHLRTLPAGGFFGIPDRVLPLVRSRLLSPAGMLRAGVDFVRPRTPLPADPSVGEVVRPRLGGEVFDRLVEPLLGGVHAGSADLLSATSTVPEVVAMARSGRSLVLTMRKRRRAMAAAAPAQAGPPAPPLVSLSGGMERLVDALVAAVGPHRVRTGSPVSSLEPSARGWVVTTPAETFLAREVVLSVPAYVAADLVEPWAPQAAAELRGIPYVDVANVTLALRRSDLDDVSLQGTGFLVPPVEGELLVGCTWLTSKWPHLVNDDVVLLRSLVGRAGDRRWVDMDDEALVAAVREALGRAMGLRAEPVDVLVQRWPAAMPQYVVGHAARLERLDAALSDSPGLTLSGAAYRGAGLAGCVAQARRSADSVLSALGSGPGTERPTRPFEGAVR